MPHRSSDIASAPPPFPSPLDEVYLERQYANLPLLGLLLALTLGLPLALQADLREGRWQGMLVCSLILLAHGGVLLFLGRLSISLNAERLRWSYGWLGWPRRELRLTNIRAVAPARSGWTEGWGIRHTRDGMLYNLRGQQAVRLTLHDGRSLRLGCSDPAVLVNAIAPRLRGGAIGPR